MIYLTLFVEFFLIGLFCFGGGFAMIPLIEDVVLKHQWLTEAEFYSFIGVCESTPGPIAVNMATYIGSSVGGLLGSFCATLGVVLPSFIIILLIAALLKNLTNNRFFIAFIKGVKPVICALIVSTGAFMLAKEIGYSVPASFSPSVPALIILPLLLLASFVYKAITSKRASSIMIILFSAVMGIAVSLLLEHI